MRRHFIKVGAALFAFLPAIVLLLIYINVLQQSLLVKSALIFNFTAIALSMAVDTAYHFNERSILIFTLVAMVLWAALISIVFWKFAGMFLNEEGLEGQKFDWVGFQIRFFCG